VLAALTPLADRVVRHGVVNALAQTTLTLAAPGVPDTFQGTEAWSLVLVDPDNRHPVDFEALSRTLVATEALRVDGAVIDEVTGRVLLDGWADARVKLLVTSRLLQARQASPELWVGGDYTPLGVECAVDASAISWLRTAGEQMAVAVAAVRTARLGPHLWPVGPAWGPSRLMLPTDLRAPRVRDLFTGAVHPVVETNSERWIFLSHALAALPVSVLVPEA
jgi:(1->4)-alpha-D-glucan 1-alpha-D-glucosylmutase